MIYVYLVFAVWLLWCVFSASRVGIQLHKVELVEHTKFANGSDAATWRLTYWRAIHGELMTHRVASRCAKSSRAIPVWKTLQQVWNAPYGPLHWGTNKPGMQAGAELTGLWLAVARTLWVLAGRTACVFAWVIMKMGGHKQWVNRILEPWQAMVAMFTFSNMHNGNFFELRAHPDAQPEFQYLAYDMQAIYNRSLAGGASFLLLPKQKFDHDRYAKLPGIRRARGNLWETMAWHLPLVTLEERLHHSVYECLQMSTARNARASYENFDGSAVTLEKDQGLFNKLVGMKPWHASPTEHACANNPVQAAHATPKGPHVYYRHPELQGNLAGTIQFRKMYEAGALWMVEGGEVAGNHSYKAESEL